MDDDGAGAEHLGNLASLQVRQLGHGRTCRVPTCTCVQDNACLTGSEYGRRRGAHGRRAASQLCYESTDAINWQAG